MNAVVKFDPVAVARSAIIREHEAGEAASRSAIAHYRRAGFELLELRDMVPPGEWMAFFEALDLPFCYRTASTYMRLARLDDNQWKRVSSLAYREALKVLAEPRVKAEPMVVDTVTLDIFPDDPQPLPAPAAVESARRTLEGPAAIEINERATDDDEDEFWSAPVDPERLAAELARRYPDYEFNRRPAPLRLIGSRAA